MYEGALVRLRAPREDDAEPFHRWINDPEVTAGLGHRYPTPLQVQRDWVRDNARPTAEYSRFSVETLGGRLLGVCGLYHVTSEHRSAELGVAIMDKTQWGRGYGTDAVRTLCRFGFDHLRLHRIELLVFAFHDRAIRAYERAGFVREAVAREAHWGNGRWYDDVYMSVLEGELR